VTEAKLIGGLVALIAIVALTGWGIVADFDAGKKSGSDAVQKLWDTDRASIQATADAAIATATKQRDDAIQANQVLHDQYETKLASVAADSATFAQRLRNAQAIIAAGSRPVPAGNSGQSLVSSSGSNSAQQLGQLVTLTTELRAECLRNDAALDDLYASVNKQPHTVQ
jgi:cytoskeletal protein RodZ